MQEAILKKLQSVELEILIVVDRICRDNGLHYYLVGGTLLGAVRHKGFIPWDDDLDIAMPRKDYVRFLELCATELPTAYYLDSYKTNPLYWFPFAKVKKNGTIFFQNSLTNVANAHKGIYIDIFPLDNANKQRSFFQDIQMRLAKALIDVIQIRRGMYGITKGRNVNILYYLTSCISIRTLLAMHQNLVQLNKDDASEYYINSGSNYHYIKQTIPKRMFHPAKQLEFEGRLFFVPNDWDYVLRRIYNDYMQLPPEDKRINHNPVEVSFGD